MPTISLPTPLRPYANKQKEVTVEGKTVGEALEQLTRTYPDLKRHLYGDDGALRSFVNVYLNDKDIRYLNKGATPVSATDVLNIIPAIAGGAPL
jgi:molybdopterin converting factor small subunit